MPQNIKDQVREYYGKTLKTNEDLKTSACCDPAAVPPHIKKALSKVHEEVLSRYYGCGLTVPSLLEGLSVLDLGSGSGRDCYVLSQLVGPRGRVVGVDMTDEQLEVANRHLEHHAKAFGYERSNVEFKNGDISKLDEAGLADSTFDLIVSNCVINLAADKEAVLREAWRVLKPGGELYFSDVYADRRVPDALRADKVLYGECLSGALYWNDFLRLAQKAGFLDPRLVESHPLPVTDAEAKAKLGDIRFYSAVYRLFKLPELEDACEDYGQSVRYKGTIETSPEAFRLDDGHIFPFGQLVPVCRNTLMMLRDSRFAPHFELQEGDGTHRGIFPCCGQELPFETGEEVSCCGTSGCCG